MIPVDRGDLPTPDAVALAHSAALEQLIDQRIAAGPLSFADYMQLVLYAPGLGYYVAGTEKFGQAGDFITAPELSPLFGRSLATQIREIFSHTRTPAILELGAGSGRLAASLLEALGEVSGLSYQILEPGAELRQRQREHLEASLGRDVLQVVSWIDRLPSGFSGVVLANEVMDAFPVERFVIGTDGVRQVQVARSDGVLRDVEQEATPVLRAAVDELQFDQLNLPPGYASEVCLLVDPWVASLADSLSAGVLLLIDYGYPRAEYYLPERNSGTLMCYYQHRAHADPYRYPGLQDLTAHVDFTRVAAAGVAAGMELLGYATQSAFLLANDLLEHTGKALARAERERDRIAIAQATRTLTLPGEMGERFQVMAFGKQYDQVLRGFSQQDLSHRL